MLKRFIEWLVRWWFRRLETPRHGKLLPGHFVVVGDLFCEVLTWSGSGVKLRPLAHMLVNEPTSPTPFYVGLHDFRAATDVEVTLYGSL